MGLLWGLIEMMCVLLQTDLLDKWKLLCELLADYCLLLCTHIFVLDLLLIDSMTIYLIIQTGTLWKMKEYSKPEWTLGSQE